MTLHEYFRAQEIAYWTELMARVGGDVGAASAEAQVHMSTVYKRMRDLGLKLQKESNYNHKLEKEPSPRARLRRFSSRSVSSVNNDDDLRG